MFWERRQSFLKVSTAGTVPVLVTEKGLVIPHSYLITDYIIGKYDKRAEIMPNDVKNQIRSKTIMMWFDEKFFHEVSKIFLYEKVIHTLKKDETPDVSALNVARYNLQIHLEFIEFLLSRNSFLGGDTFSIADVVGSVHISVLDYLSEIKWASVSPAIKDWYSIMKSKLAFKELLHDTIPSIKPGITYEALDF